MTTAKPPLVSSAHATITYELRVAFDPKDPTAKATKQKVIEWLLFSGVESFVEGALDVDYNHEYGQPERDFFTEFGGDSAPISIYRYSKESLDDLQLKIERAFSGKLAMSLHTMPTEQWMEGWKESFKPFSTDTFYVRPPWSEEATPAGLLAITIEPGMAFGTGQHATTRLCLDQLGLLWPKVKAKAKDLRVLDVGTGTGILAIGAKLLGAGHVAGTDIDEDALLASAENAKTNAARVEFSKGSVLAGAGHDIVFANILAVVLLRIMDQLAAALAPGGFLVLSGILVEEEAELTKKGKSLGLRHVTAGRQDGWSCLVLTK